MYLISDGGINCNTLDTIESIMLTKNNLVLDGVKLDVRKTIDNIYVLSRYDDLSKLTLSNNLISKSKYSYIKKVKFPSLIFKYYIPTLEEILKSYNKDKIIVLELFNNNLDNLYNIVNKYSYKYYFFSKDKDIVQELKNKHFDKIGSIINKEDIIKTKTNNLYSNTFLIKE